MLGNGAIAQFAIAQFPPTFGPGVADTTRLTLPVNCVMAGNQPLKQTQIWDVRDPNIRVVPRVFQGRKTNA